MKTPASSSQKVFTEENYLANFVQSVYNKQEEVMEETHALFTWWELVGKLGTEKNCHKAIKGKDVKPKMVELKNGTKKKMYELVRVTGTPERIAQ